jgi:hypothetical protein
MPWYQWLLIIAVIGWGIYGIRQQLKKRVRRKRLQQLQQTFSGRRYGVVFNDPKGNPSEFESLIINALNRYGAVCVSVQRSEAVRIYEGVPNSKDLERVDAIIVGAIDLNRNHGHIGNIN